MYRFGWYCVVLVAAGVLSAAGSRAAAEALTIYEIQYTEDASGAGPLTGQIVDCAGGIVTHKFPGFKPKLTLQNPDFPDGWGAIQVKDWTGGLELFDSVDVGDWVSLVNVEVEEAYGNTLLHYKSGNQAGYDRLSTGNPLPTSRLVAPDEIAAPVEGPPGEWYVADRSAERYEAMRLKILDVTVTDVDLGNFRDNYNLRGQAGDVWAGDYMNVDCIDVYHPYITVGAHFESVSGILEQYLRVGEYDYYQLLTTETSDLVIPEPTSLMILLAAGLAGAAKRSTRKSPADCL